LQHAKVAKIGFIGKNSRINLGEVKNLFLQLLYLNNSILNAGFYRIVGDACNLTLTIGKVNIVSSVIKPINLTAIVLKQVLHFKGLIILRLNRFDWTT
jgi:hypothetical protein